MNIFYKVWKILTSKFHRKPQKPPTYAICHRCMGTGKLCGSCECNEHACQCQGYHHKLRICDVCTGSGRILVY
jgi:hypothetical protein